jgi:hypothetical protein
MGGTTGRATNNESREQVFEELAERLKGLNSKEN